MTEVGNDSIRGPGLAKLEIERRKLKYGRGNAEKLMEDITLYFSRYSFITIFFCVFMIYK